MENTAEEKALQDFLLDIECLDELIPWTGKVNLFDVLKVSKKEIYHSNMLAWLLDPNENHGLGEAFLKGILQKLVENDEEGKYDVFDILLSDLHSFSVYREWKRIDILLVSTEEKMLFAIENKVASIEHGKQLDTYRETLGNDYSDYKRFYIFLTPEGDKPSDQVNWDILTYLDVVEVLEKIIKSTELEPNIKLILENYIYIIRRDIVENSELISICNKIYNKHRDALTLIFENVNIDNFETEIICETLCELEKKGKIIFKDKGKRQFYTSKMDEFLPLLDEPQRHWGPETKRVYCYWFEKKENKLVIHFELGYEKGSNQLPDALKKKTEALSRTTGNNKSKDFKYRRLYTKSQDLSQYLKENNEEESIKKTVMDLVKSALENEEKLLAKVAEQEEQ